MSYEMSGVGFNFGIFFIESKWRTRVGDFIDQRQALIYGLTV